VVFPGRRGLDKIRSYKLFFINPFTAFDFMEWDLRRIYFHLGPDGTFTGKSVQLSRNPNISPSILKTEENKWDETVGRNLSAHHRPSFCNFELRNELYAYAIDRNYKFQGSKKKSTSQDNGCAGCSKCLYIPVHRSFLNSNGIPILWISQGHESDPPR